MAEVLQVGVKVRRVLRHIFVESRVRGRGREMDGLDRLFVRLELEIRGVMVRLGVRCTFVMFIKYFADRKALFTRRRRRRHGARFFGVEVRKLPDIPPQL